MATSRPRKRRAAPSGKIHLPRGGHEYRWYGEYRPGVTTVLKTLHKELAPAAARLTASWCISSAVEIIQARLDRDTAAVHREATGHYRDAWDLKASRGTTVHQHIEDALRHPENPPDPECPLLLQPYMNTWGRFMEHWGTPRALMTEQVVFHPEGRYAGTLDAVLEVGEVGNVIVDWKTGRLYPDEQILQLAGLMGAPIGWRPRTLIVDGTDPKEWKAEWPEIAEAWVVRIGPNDWELVRAGTDTIQQAASLFFSILDVWERRGQDWVFEIVREEESV